MAKFIYTAKDNSGRTIRGEVEAPEKARALEILREKNLLILKLEGVKVVRTVVSAELDETPLELTTYSLSRKSCVKDYVFWHEKIDSDKSEELPLEVKAAVFDSYLTRLLATGI